MSSANEALRHLRACQIARSGRCAHGSQPTLHSLSHSLSKSSNSSGLPLLDSCLLAKHIGRSCPWCCVLVCCNQEADSSCNATTLNNKVSACLLEAAMHHPYNLVQVRTCFIHQVWFCSTSVAQPMGRENIPIHKTHVLHNNICIHPVSL